MGTDLARTIIRTGILALAALTMSGCVLIDGSAHRSGPDEFGVVTRAPLSQPPDYALRPPRTGAQRPNEVSPRDEARSQLLNVSARSGDSAYAAKNGAGDAKGASAANGGSQKDGLTNGEHALLKQADALNVDPEIRNVIDRESGRVLEDDSLVDKLVFWKSKDKSGGKAIDAKREADRLSRNAALGIPPTENEPKSR
jgi:hypothetical protein